MNKQKKKLLINLISSFLILLCICLIIALIINLKYSQDCATVITAMLGVCATLYAPIAAFFLYDSWKDQKQYELEKQYAEETFKLISQLNTSISREYYIFKNIKSDLTHELIALNSLYNIQKDNSNYSEVLYNAKTYFELTSDISSEKIKNDFFDNFEYIFIILQQKLKDIRGSYDEYYKELPADFKISLNTTRLYKDTHKYEILKCDQLDRAESNLVNHLNNKFKFEINPYHQGNYIYFEFTYEDAYLDFEQKYKDLKIKLIHKIKVNKESI